MTFYMLIRLLTVQILFQGVTVLTLAAPVQVMLMLYTWTGDGELTIALCTKLPFNLELFSSSVNLETLFFKDGLSLRYVTQHLGSFLHLSKVSLCSSG